MGLGMIIRDSEGKINASSCCNLISNSPPTVAEAMTLKHVMQVCSDLGLTGVIFERDCKTVFIAVNSCFQNDTVLRLLIFDI